MFTATSRCIAASLAYSDAARSRAFSRALTAYLLERTPMDLTVIPTFRCNSRCQMCYIWKNPTEPKLEVTAETLAKLPGGFDNLNLSGGAPTLRRDLATLVDILYPKARIMEISSNGLHPEKLVPIIKKYPNIKVRFSLEGDEATSNRIR